MKIPGVTSEIFETTYESYLENGDKVSIIIDRETGQEYILITNVNRMSITARIGKDRYQ